MSENFTGIYPRNYVFRTDDGERDVIALYAGSKRIGFIEYSAAYRLSNDLVDMAERHESNFKEKNNEQ